MDKENMVIEACLVFHLLDKPFIQISMIYFPSILSLGHDPAVGNSDINWITNKIPSYGGLLQARRSGCQYKMVRFYMS